MHASDAATTPRTGDGARGAHGLLFDLSAIDLSRPHADREGIERINPHRHEMVLLDEVLWVSDDRRRCVGRRVCREDEFWVRGHFPQRAMFPGVLMVEAGAQLSAYLWNIQQDEPKLAAFLRIQDCAFRRSVGPGDALLLLCQEVKNGRRRFVTDVQGIVGGPEHGEVAFEAQISGMALEDAKQP